MNLLLLLALWSYPRLEAEPPNLFPYRGIYLYPFAAVKFTEYLPKIRDSEINCVVVDFKSGRGYVTYNSRVKLAKTMGAELPIINLESFVRTCEEQGLRLIGRIVVFHDSILACHEHGRYSIKGLDRRIWKDGHGGYWADPCLDVPRAYSIAIAKDLASRGVPEIQFDYIRFPSATGDFRPYIQRCRSKRETIGQFLKDANAELKPFGVEISADVYGCALWIPTLAQEGQSLELMAPHLDVICPMLYPSHFPKKYAWSSDPREREYDIISGSVERGVDLLGESRFVPYIQGFDLMSPGFGPGYIANQIKAVQDSPGWGYIIWHAASRYDPLWELLDEGGYSSKPTTFEGKIRRLITTEVRPFLESQGGDIDLVSVRDGVIKIRLKYGCRRSPLEHQFYLDWVETKLKENMDGIRQVEGV
jgi:Fe-S cluster biogenesis protein NfuA